MKKYVVHYSVHLATDFEVEADSKNEALEKAFQVVDRLDFNRDFNFGDEEYDIIQ